MGMIQDAKIGKIGLDATNAIQAGRRRFLVRINVASIRDAGFSGEVIDAGPIIEAVESRGWTITHMSYTNDKKGQPEGYFLFGR